MDFFIGDWNVTDRRQNRRIRELEEGLDQANQRVYHERSRLRSELSQVRGSLEARLDAISASFDAFVELSDLRAVLAMFTDTALARHRTRQILSGDRPDELHLDDDSGYWLVPAAYGLHALTRGDVGTAQARFAEAAERDQLRAQVFAALATAVIAPEHTPAIAGHMLPNLLPELPNQVKRWQRALWLLTADGVLGEGAREELRLRTQSALRERGRPPVHADAWQTAGSPPRLERSPVSLSGTGEIRDRLVAAAQLRALRERLEQAFDSAAAEVGEDVPDTPLSPTPLVAETLRMLIDEGSPEEAPLLERALQLRGVIESSGSASAETRRPTWNAEVGSSAQFLLSDATDSTAPMARRTFAFSFQSTHALSVAESLAQQAQQPWTGQAVLTEQGQRVPVTPDGPVRDALLDAEAAIAARYPARGSERRPAVFAGAAIGVLLLAVGATAASLLAVLGGVAAFCWSGWALLQDSDDHRNTAAAAEQHQERMRTATDKATRHLRYLLDEADAAGARAAQDLEAIRRLLDRF
ncbi:hypothetical protein CDO52_24000 [Nocardiopsis gilva YIM 90087]|uniref:Uncharacterized protein n=1 Tax=Nocardiopsis gilva YIM 90087 TaxID=1235441 RepID=A0A223SBB1_9ACTN|nr:hypothetical protein CDO52_24000 [Nocardiopsis gilva YIM 90087]